MYMSWDIFYKPLRWKQPPIDLQRSLTTLLSALEIFLNPEKPCLFSCYIDLHTQSLWHFGGCRICPGSCDVVILVWKLKRNEIGCFVFSGLMVCGRSFQYKMCPKQPVLFWSQEWGFTLEALQDVHKNTYITVERDLRDKSSQLPHFSD